MRWRRGLKWGEIPLNAASGPHTLRQYDVTANAWKTLGDLGDQVRLADWSVSPDGRRLNFLSARDGNVRVLTLP